MTGLLNADPNHQAQIILLAGFLGSGKTTLLKNLLASEEDLSGTVVVVNEFGKIGIDGAILKQAGTDVFELASGCICCSLKADLTRTLKEIWNRFHPKNILIEATGIAEPGAVAAVMEDAELRQTMRLKKIVTVLDIRYWLGREIFGSFFMNQVSQADVVLLNKVDTVDEALVSQSLCEIHQAVPGIRVIPTLYSAVDPEVIWGDASQIHYPGCDHEHRHGECLALDLNGDGHPHNGHQFTDFAFVDPRALDEGRFKNFLEGLPWDLFRVKGPVRFPERTVLLNFVGGQSDWEPWPEGQGTRLAFVGWKINSKEMLESLEQCIMPD